VRTTIALACSVVLIGLGAVAVGQDKPPALKAAPNQKGGLRFVDTSEISVVNVEVSVTNKKGPVLGLTPRDFEVYQDGKPQSITNFTFYRSSLVETGATARPEAAPAPAPAATPAVAQPAPGAAVTPVAEGEPRPPEPRFLALYVDNENILPQNRNRVIGQVIEFMQGHLREPDKAMVVSYQRSLKIIQPFTSDPDEVNSALRRLKKYTGGRSEMISSRRQIEEYISENADRSSSSSTADGYAQAVGRIDAFAREQRNSLVFTVRSIQELVGMMSGLPGKKSIIYISDGLPMSPGLELYYELQDRFHTASTISQSREFEASDLFRGLGRRGDVHDRRARARVRDGHGG
jgi:VWFA-related protein